MAPDVFRVVTIDSDGTTASAEWDTTDGTLALLQDAVGGFVDVVPLHPTITMWVNDTGLVDAQPINWVATTIARAFGLTHQPYAGPVVFTGGADDDGATLRRPPDDHPAPGCPPHHQPPHSRLTQRPGDGAPQRPPGVRHPMPGGLVAVTHLG